MYYTLITHFNVIGVQRVRELLAARRIPGVIRTGRSLLIPADAPLPAHNDRTQYDYDRGEYLSQHEYCQKYGVSPKRIKVMREAGELPDVIEADGRLYFPSNYPKPEDRRIVDGSYIGWRNRYR